MRVAALVYGVPNPTSGGGPLTVWSVLMHLVRAGHDVGCVVVHDPGLVDPQGWSLERRVAALREAQVEVRTVRSEAGQVFDRAPRTVRARLRRARRPPDIELFPQLVDGARVRDAVAELEPEAVFVYHFEALAASRHLSFPRVAGVGDPSHLPGLYRLRAALPSPAAARQLLAAQGRLRNQPRLMVDLLNECAVSGAFAAHHAAWLRSRGAGRTQYFRTPVPDPGVLADATPAGGPARLLLLGHLRGIATLDGLRVFARALPALDRLIGHDGYEARIVGGGPPLPDDLRRALDHPAVAFLGHTDDPTSELATAHALVVPTSIRLGVRVRILTGLAHGAVVVSHAANALGIPELEDGVNALLASTPDALAAAVVRAARDADLRTRLRTGARATYERYFAPDVAAAAIEDSLAGVVRPRSGV